MNENSNSSIVLAEGVHKTYDAGRVKVAALSNYLKMARRHCRRNHRSAHASCNTPR